MEAAAEATVEVSPALAVALEVFGFASVDEFVAWGNTASQEQLESVGLTLALILQAQGGS